MIVKNVTAAGMLAQVTRLFFAMGRYSLLTRLYQWVNVVSWVMKIHYLLKNYLILVFAVH